MSEPTKPKFTHLHVHSHYSLLDGLGKIDDLLDRAKELGMDSLALTDHGVMYGAVEFFMKAKAKGLKPIIGCEMYVSKNRLSKNPTTEDRKMHHLTLLVKNEEGYKNLMKLVSIAHLEGFYYKPRIDKEILRKYSEGLIGMSGCLAGEIPSLINEGRYEKAKNTAQEYEEMFGKGNFYMELQHHPDNKEQVEANEGMVKIFRQTEIPVVATGDIHYVQKEDAEIQDVLLCIQTNRKVQEKDRMNMTAFDLSMRPPEEMAAAFKGFPEALENTQRVVELCNFQLTLGETLLPAYDVPENFTPESYLRHLAEKGLRKRYAPLNKNSNADASGEFNGIHPVKSGEAGAKLFNGVKQEHIDRLNYELSVIEKTGFASYFLIVQDFVNWAKDQGIVVGPGRGSAAGSFISYLVGITNIDPIKYNLLFERFLNPERISMPDVDLDFADDRRDEVLDYVRKKYGQDHVAQIITFGTMAARAAIRDAGRALGYPYDFCDKTAKMIPMFSSIEKALQDVAEFKQFYSGDASAKKLIDSAKRLEGVARHASMHACGVVITKEPVTNYTPLQKIAGKGEGMVTQYSSSTKSSYVEKIGLLKMDFLGLKNLTIIQNTLRIVKKTRGVEINIDDIPLDNEETFRLLQRAETTGVFQLESTGMKRYLRLLKPTVFEDIIAMVALYRPGPMDWIPDFVAGKHGRKKVKYLHPKLEPILQNTYGVAVYQEQVMQIARDLAGFTLGEADVLRKAMGKKIPELIKEQRIKFIASAVKHGVDQKIAEKVFDFIEPFAGYGFNRSHAACYALIGYQTAYLKAHFPAEFMAALLTSDQDNIDRIAIEVFECREMGVEVLAPDINESFEEFAVIKGEDGKERIRFGLNAVKNVGHNVAHEIVEERKRNGKYKGVADLISRVETKDLNKKSLEALFKVGALDAFGERSQFLAGIEAILAFSKNLQKQRNSNQTSLFGEMELETPTIIIATTEPASKKQTLQWEKELIGLYISDHPVAEYKDYFAKIATPINQLDKSMVGNHIRVGGIISKVHKIYTKSQQLMCFVTIEDLHGKIELLVFPRTLEKVSGMWDEDKIILAEGKLSDKDGNFKLLIEDAKEINQMELDNFTRILATQRANGHVERKAEAKNTLAKNNGTPLEKTGEPENLHENKNKRLLITLPPSAGKEDLQKLSQFFDRCEFGGTKVYISINNSRLETPYCIKQFHGLEQALETLLPGGRAEII